MPYKTQASVNLCIMRLKKACVDHSILDDDLYTHTHILLIIAVWQNN